MTKKTAVAEERDVIALVLTLEDDVRQAAHDYPSGDNSDAMKAALQNCAHGIAHIRKVLAANAAVSR